MNKFLGVGNVGDVPDRIGNGCKLSLCTEVWDGTKLKNIWLKVLVFGKCADTCLKYLEKGRKIEIEGRVDVSVSGSMVIIASDVKFL
jgi:single-stranded DNA-binding protein